MSLKHKSIIAVQNVYHKFTLIDSVTRVPSSPIFPVIGGTLYGLSESNDSNYIALTHSISPYFQVYDVHTWTKVSIPTVLPSAACASTAFNPDDSLLAVGSNTTPYILIYNTSDWSKLVDPSELPTGAVSSVKFSKDGSLLAVSHTTTPFITIYNTSDWTKVTNPSTLPAGNGHSVDFNDDDSLMVVGHFTSPYITIYNTATWSKLTNPSSLPNYTGRDVTFSPDGSKLAVAHDIAPTLTLYNTSDWTKRSITQYTREFTAGTIGYKCPWIDNNNFLFTCNSVPPIVTYDATTGVAYDPIDYLPPTAINAISIRGSKWEINGTIDEALVADTWIALVFDVETKSILGTVEFTGVSFTVPVPTSNPVTVTVYAKQGDMWEASLAGVALDQLVFPTDPISTPYYYKATGGGGTTGATEPVWPVDAGGTVVDGTVTWQRVERLIQPISQSPLIPTVVV